jgi:hypothetical protein
MRWPRLILLILLFLNNFDFSFAFFLLDYVRQEVEFCEQSARESQMAVLEWGQNGGRHEQRRNNRTGRQAGYDDSDVGMPQASLGTGIPLQTECPGCCIPGPPGKKWANRKMLNLFPF